MPEDQLVIVLSNKNNAMIACHTFPSEGMIGSVSTYILGSGERGWDHASNLKRTYCVGASSKAIINSINNHGFSKHTTLRKSGNAFSRIAHLVEVGFSSVAGHTGAGAHSGVVFRWTEKDLIKYIGKWIHVLEYHKILDQTHAECEEKARYLSHRYHILRSYYQYESDNKLSVMTEGQFNLREEQTEQAQKEGNMITI